MINVASIRAAAVATPGEHVALTKVQLDQLLEEIETGHRAYRLLKSMGAIGKITGAGTDGVSAG